MGKDWDNSIEGMTERTERAFRQDAELAMGADPIRAIVELVTNSDDAYVKLRNGRKGSIRIVGGSPPQRCNTRPDNSQRPRGRDDPRRDAGEAWQRGIAN
jgi:hypothetical protein